MATVSVEDGESRIFWSAWLSSGYGKDWIKIEARFDARKVLDEDRALILNVIDYAKAEIETLRLEREQKVEVVKG